MKPETVISEINSLLQMKGTGQESLLTFKIKVRILINQYYKNKQ